MIGFVSERSEDLLDIIDAWIESSRDSEHFYKNNSNRYAPAKYLGECIGVTRREFYKKMTGFHDFSEKELVTIMDNLKRRNIE